MTTACKNCSQWQPDSSAARMVQHGFANCSRQRLAWRYVSADFSCSRFDALPADQVDARRKAATAAVRALKEKK